MVWLRIRVMTRRGQVRKAIKQSYHFLEGKYTEVTEPLDIEYFLTQRDIFEVSDDGKEVKEKTAEAIVSPVKVGMTKDKAYQLTKEQQVAEIKRLGGNPKDYPHEADRVKFIIESYGGK